MIHRVPDFEMENEALIPSSPEFVPQREPIMAEEEELLELIWQNGQVVAQIQNQRCPKSLPSKFGEGEAILPDRPGSGPRDEIKSCATAAASQLFIQEDEMAAWLHCPIDESLDRDFCSNLPYSGSTCNSTVAGRIVPVPLAGRLEEMHPASTSAPAMVTPSRPPIYPKRVREASAPAANAAHFSRGKGMVGSRPPGEDRQGKESTVVDSSLTPAPGEARAMVSHWEIIGGGNIGCASTCDGSGERETGTCEMTLTSSSGVSGAWTEQPLKPPADDRKRKMRQADESESPSKDDENDSDDERRTTRRTSSARRARAAEVHNQSERRRRDRINEKMKALQELIPRCNKSDKASMLDEAIEYLKTLQLQVQMMSMGCSMLPMMFSGMQQFMPPMGMGMNMGMEMAAANGFNRPMLPFPPIMPGTVIPGSSPNHLSPSFSMPPFLLPQISPSDQSKVQATNALEAASNLVNFQPPNVTQKSPNMIDPYHQFFGLHFMQVPPQEQGTALQTFPNKVVGTPETQ